MGKAKEVFGKSNIIVGAVALFFVVIVGIVTYQQLNTSEIELVVLDRPQEEKVIEPEVEEPGVISSGKVTQRTIVIDDFKFNPTKLTVTTGTKITWVNRDYIKEDQLRAWPHTIKIFVVNVRSPKLQTDEEFSYTFDVVGEYKFIDSIYSKTMKGTITVVDESIALTGGVVIDIKTANPMVGLIAIVIMLSIAIGFFAGFKGKKGESYRGMPVKMLSFALIILMLVIPS